jgi:small multidrug resistance pump
LQKDGLRRKSQLYLQQTHNKAFKNGRSKLRTLAEHYIFIEGLSMGYWYLAIAISAEVIATLALKASDGFSHLTSSTICVIGYVVAFYFLSLVLKTVPVGIAYAIWAGMGIFLIASISAVIHKQIPDLPAIIGMCLILTGVVVINVFSKTVSH